MSRLYEGELFAAATDESKGLGALEYLLFYQGTDNGCSADTAINATGSWAALSQDELKVRKRAYAKAAAAEVLIHARELLSAWEKDKGNFLTQLASAGQGSQVFATQQAALNAVSDGLFYLEVVSKDRKLAQPLDEELYQDAMSRVCRVTVGGSGQGAPAQQPAWISRAVCWWHCES